MNRRRFLAKLGGLAPKTNPTYKIPQAIPLSAAFYVQHYTPQMPHIRLEKWHLRLTGLPAPKIITWEHLISLPSVESIRTIVSIVNPPGGALIGTATWRGVRPRDLIPNTRAKYAKFTALDGYQTALPLEVVLHEDALLAYEMNGVPLPAQHGYPLRLLVGGKYGHKMPKWISQIELTNEPFLGNWERLGWSDNAEVQTHSFFTTPVTESHIQGEILLEGLAFAGNRAIIRVEISVDGDQWQVAHLVSPPSPLAWTSWYLPWMPPAPGLYSLQVRATDSAGFTQHEVPQPFFKQRQATAGNAFIHQITLEVTG